MSLLESLCRAAVFTTTIAASTPRVNTRKNKQPGTPFKMTTTITTMLIAVAAALLAAFPPGAKAQGYPARAPTFVVPFAPGGATDTLARQFAERMGRGAKQPFV